MHRIRHSPKATLLTISIEFSVISALMLLGTYALLHHRWNKSWTSITCSAITLLTFYVIQLLHLQHLDNPENLFATKCYSVLILLSAPVFYLFLRECLLEDARLTLRSCLYSVPLSLILLIENRFTIPAALVISRFDTTQLNRMELRQRAKSHFAVPEAKDA